MWQKQEQQERMLSFTKSEKIVLDINRGKAWRKERIWSKSFLKNHSYINCESFPSLFTLQSLFLKELRAKEQKWEFPTLNSRVEWFSIFAIFEMQHISADQVYF